MATDTAVIVARLQAHLRAVEARYPHAWRQAESLRLDRTGLDDWPRWCYLPLAGAYAIVTGGQDVDWTSAEWTGRAIDIAVVGALSAWRATQGIYRIDPDLLDGLWATPLDGDLPAELLERLPEWCVYVETPHRGTADAEPLAGFFAHLEYDVTTTRTELRLLLDQPQADGRLLLTPLILHLGHGSLAACVAAAMDESERQARATGLWDATTRAATEHVRHQARALTAPLVSLLLYLCAEASEIRDARGTDRLPHYARPAKTKRGMREFPPDGPTTWDVGWRVGAALRAAHAAATSGLSDGAHAGPRAHLRRAHWHTYWTGPRAQSQRAVLRWLHPMLVGAGDIVPTIHQVGG